MVDPTPPGAVTVTDLLAAELAQATTEELWRRTDAVAAEVKLLRHAASGRDPDLERILKDMDRAAGSRLPGDTLISSAAERITDELRGVLRDKVESEMRAEFKQTAEWELLQLTHQHAELTNRVAELQEREALLTESVMARLLGKRRRRG